MTFLDNIVIIQKFKLLNTKNDLFGHFSLFLLPHLCLISNRISCEPRPWILLTGRWTEKREGSTNTSYKWLIKCDLYIGCMNNMNKGYQTAYKYLRILQINWQRVFLRQNPKKHKDISETLSAILYVFLVFSLMNKFVQFNDS